MYSAIAVGDINGDGLMDFVITGVRNEPGVPPNTKVFEIYYNLGNNTFRKRDDTGISPASWGSVHIADLNGDGRADIFVNGQGVSGNISNVYFQQEDGSFVLSENSFIGTYFSASAIFDANSDGLLDILITGFGSDQGITTSQAKLYLNKGEGVFIEQESGLGGVHFPSISVADFEGDGDLDILIMGINLASNTRSLILYLNDGTGSFTPSSFEFEGLAGGSCALVDYNKDGFLDVFAFGGNSNNVNQSYFYDNHNNESFTLNEVNSAVVPGLYNSSAVWFDYDNDGDLDLFVTGYNDGITQAILFENTIDYCEASVEYTAQAITKVSLANLVNETESTVGGTTPGYINFTEMTANLQKGETYTLRVKGNTDGAFTQDIRVFIDWNQDLQFDMATEYYAASLEPSTGVDDVEAVLTIRVPDNAVLGDTRIRIIKDHWTAYEEDEISGCLDAYYGQIHDYTVNIAEATVEPVCNNDEPGMNPGDTGCVSFVYNGQQVIYTTVRAADGSIWLQQNLGSDQVATAATDQMGYGDLFQWGRWDDGHQNRNSPVSSATVSPNNPLGVGQSNGGFILSTPIWWEEGTINDTWNATTVEGISATDGCDPCKALGEGWRLPTQEDWGAVIQAESISNIQAAFDSNLRLPMAGTRGTRGVYGEGKGYYWSSTASPDNGALAKYVYINDRRINSEFSGYRQRGNSVRCIKAAKAVVSAYCEPEVGNGSYSLPIYEFTFDGQTKTSGDGTNQAPPYEDFTAEVLEVEQGQTYDVVVKGKTDGQNNILVRAYIDFNQDFTFSEEESIDLGFLNNIGGERGELTASIQIPASALAGSTRMRIVSMYHNPESTQANLKNVPCPVGYYLGQVEDYTINISNGIPVTGVEVSTENDSPTEITTENGTLQLVARVLPTEADQTVVWSITAGEDFASVDQNGLVTALENGEVTVKATSVRDNTKFAELTLMIDIEALRCPEMNLTVGQIEEEKATLAIASRATAFEIEYGVEGFERGEGTTLSMTSSTQLIEGLTAETTYDVYVRTSTCEAWQKVSFTTIKLKEQVITVEDVSKVYGDAPFAVGEASSHLPLTYTSTNETLAVVENGLLTIKGAGEVEIIVNQAGNDEYLAAEEVRFVLQVAKAPLTVRATDQTKVYDGEVYTQWTVNYDGFVYNENAAVLTGDLLFGGTAVEATQAGDYLVEVRGLDSSNYAIAYETGRFEITKAPLLDIVFENGQFEYDGTAKSILITQNLPEGVTVTYVGNNQTEIGTYRVTALLNGGTNYQDRELEARMIIRHQLAGLVLEDAVFEYDGTVKALAVRGELPEGVTVSYANNEKIDAGTYRVTATISGGERYGDLVLTANLTITKARIEGITLADQTFVYDGTPKSIFVRGPIPRGVTVEHLNNGKIDVGSYQVEAKVNGGTNYSDQYLTGTLTIVKADQTLTFDELTTLILDESEDFQLQARSTSSLPIQYTYTYSDTKPAAEVSESGWVTRKKVGEITITASQKGDKNHQDAIAVTRTLRIVNNDATIHDLWIDGEAYQVEQKEIYYFIECQDEKTEVSFKIGVDEGAQVDPTSEFVIRVPKPGIYKHTVTVTSQNGQVKENYVIIVEKAFAFQEIAHKKFNNTLLINKNPQTNGGYHFVGFQWFKNGTLVSEEQVYSVGNTGVLDYRDVYHAIVTTKEGEQIHVCPMVDVQDRVGEIKLYPNPVVSGQPTTLSVPVSGIELRGIPVQIYNLGGQLLHTVFMDGEITEITLPQSMPSGMYMAVFELNGQKESIKFAVKK
ncbi:MULTISPECIES: FG-GAP-like repeat-containing protein [unclassified Myroides]|uniref:FG-GAP-like repeat-containing protein n=1 Tax=unclassified Myroides TaxID=2642485 RepID=UPI003D2F867A